MVVVQVILSQLIILPAQIIVLSQLMVLAVQILILSQIIIRTVNEWKNPGWFTQWVSSTGKKEAEEFLQNTLDDLIELELFEFSKERSE